MNKIPIMALLIVIILSGMIYIYFRMDIDEKVKEYLGLEPDNSEEEPEPPPEDDDDPSPPPIYTSGGPGGGDSGGGGGGGGDGDSDSSEPTCILQQISYSLKNFEKTQTCNQYDQGACINKTVTCSLQLTNLDFETSGTFEMRFNFFEAGQDEILESLTDSHNVGPRSPVIFSTSAQFQGPDADKDLTCNFHTEQIPKKEVCF